VGLVRQDKHGVIWNFYYEHRINWVDHNHLYIQMVEREQGVITSDLADFDEFLQLDGSCLSAPGDDFTDELLLKKMILELRPDFELTSQEIIEIAQSRGVQWVNGQKIEHDSQWFRRDNLKLVDCLTLEGERVIDISNGKFKAR
jgi:hypothetical protein